MVSKPAEVITKTSWWMREVFFRGPGGEEARMSLMMVLEGMESSEEMGDLGLGEEEEEEVRARWASTMALVSRYVFWCWGLMSVVVLVVGS